MDVTKVRLIPFQINIIPFLKYKNYETKDKTSFKFTNVRLKKLLRLDLDLTFT